MDTSTPEQALLAVSPLDGRYHTTTEVLSPYFSEHALFRFRFIIELAWLKMLLKQGASLGFTKIPASLEKKLSALENNYSLESSIRIKAIEKTCHHDVKAVEYYLKEQMAKDPELAPYQEWVHFACTSEDINNLAYGLMIKTSLHEILIPALANIYQDLCKKAMDYSSIAMLSRTHGQPATPTTLGKEIANVAYRLKRQLDHLQALPVLGKFNGAVGNYNAHIASFADLDWPTLNQQFVEGLGLVFNPYTTQIEPHDYLAEIFHVLSQISTVMIDFSRDAWGYISLGYFDQTVKEEEVGSSTMPHKVNPIDFENAEGNFALAQALGTFLAQRLPVSRFQRDLVDSTLLRNIGAVFGYALIAAQALTRGLAKITPNKAVITENLQAHPEILAEAIQTVLRAAGQSLPYEKLKQLTRGKTLTLEDLHRFINTLDIPKALAASLLTLTPENYIGAAKKLAEKVSSA